MKAAPLFWDVYLDEVKQVAEAAIRDAVAKDTRDPTALKLLTKSELNSRDVTALQSVLNRNFMAYADDQALIVDR